jgi:hypothetical protein
VKYTILKLEKIILSKRQTYTGKRINTHYGET